jgi:hypothetical protein
VHKQHIHPGVGILQRTMVTLSNKARG